MGKIKHLRELSFKAAFALYFAVAIICATAAVYSLRLTADMIRGNIEWKYENLSARYAMPEGGSADTVYENDRASFVLRDADGTVTDRFSYSYSEAKLTTKLGAGGQVEFFELSPLYSAKDRFVHGFWGAFSFAIIPVAYGAGTILCAVVFYNTKLKKPLFLLTQAYTKVAENDLNFKLAYNSGDEMGRLCAAFENMRAALEANNSEMWRQMDERKRLNAAFSHDLRTPLTVLKGRMEMLKSSVVEGHYTDAELTDELEIISANITRLENYVEAMSSLQRLEDIPIRRTPVQFTEMVSGLKDTAEILLGEKCVFRVDAAEKTLLLDMETATLVYENLLSNAQRFAQKRVEIHIFLSKNFLMFSISDDGPGFSSEALKRATEPFFRGEKKSGGLHMGLGLNICKVLCRRHGGDITIANRAQGGAEVTACFAVF